MALPLRVAHVISVMDFGGVEAMALLLLKQLPTNEFEHHLIYVGNRQPARSIEFEAISSSFSTVPYRLLHSWSFVKHVRRLLEEHKIDVVLCHNFGHHPFVGMAASQANIHRVYTIVASSPCISSSSRWRNQLKGWLGKRRCKLEVAVSSTVAQELETEIGLPASRIRTIVNCCLTEEIGERADASRQGRQDTTPQLLMVARMDDAKDHPTLLRALALLKQQGRPLKLCLAGDGPQKSALMQMSEQLGISDLVIFHGARHDIPELLGGCDLFIFATKTEGFGLALIEAMSAEVPIIATDLPICRQILDEGSCGMLVPAGDAERLAQAITTMLDQPEQAKAFARQARQRARAQYSPAFTVGQYARLLRGELDTSS